MRLHFLFCIIISLLFSINLSQLVFSTNEQNKIIQINNSDAIFENFTIFFECSGVAGPLNTTLLTTSFSLEEQKTITDLLNNADFFNETNVTPSQTKGDMYGYTVTIETNNGEKETKTYNEYSRADKRIGPLIDFLIEKHPRC